DSVNIDTLNPTVSVNIVDAALNDGDSSSVVTFTFSEVPVGFGEADIQLSPGLSLVAGSLHPDAADPSGKTFTATVTATDGFSGTGTVSLGTGSYTDAAGNAGGGGSDSVNIDTLNPTVSVNIVDAALNDGDSSSVVTFTFSEVPVGFGEADIQLSPGLSLVAG